MHSRKDLALLLDVLLLRGGLRCAKDGSGSGGDGEDSGDERGAHGASLEGV